MLAHTGSRAIPCLTCCFLGQLEDLHVVGGGAPWVLGGSLLTSVIILTRFLDYWEGSVHREETLPRPHLKSGLEVMMALRASYIWAHFFPGSATNILKHLLGTSCSARGVSTLSCENATSVLWAKYCCNFFSIWGNWGLERLCNLPQVATLTVG